RRALRYAGAGPGHSSPPGHRRGMGAELGRSSASLSLPMRHSLLLGLSCLGLLLAPSRAEAQWSLRLALEAPLYVHSSSNGQSSSFGINDSFQPTVDLIGSYFVTRSVGLDLELRTGIAATGTGYTRPRTSLGPGVTLDDPAFPLYGRVSFPIQVESTVVAFFR